MKLTPKQKAFADYYIECGNATEAARRAGYKGNPKTLSAVGIENLGKPGISAYIAERQGEIDSIRICTLKEIQEFRSKVLRGEEKGMFGLGVDTSDRLKAASDLEKALRIKAAEDEKKAAEEAARNAKTYHLDLDMIPDPFHAAIRDIRNQRHAEYVFKGGRGSTKSSTISMMIVELLKNNKEMHALVCRKVSNTIKDSVFAKIRWAIEKQGLEAEFQAIKSPFEITIKVTGQKIYFRGADDPDKIKSIAPEFGYIGILWFEELDQFSGPEEVRNIRQSAIRGGESAWVFKSFNPPKTKDNWANKYVNEPNPNMLVHSSTYKDVPSEWLGRPFIEEAEHLKEVNPDAYEHEYDGVPNGNGGNVFDKLSIRTITDDEIARFDRIYQGVDWGWFPDQYAFLRVYYDSTRELLYLLDELYVNKWGNDKTAQWITDKGYDDYTINCDSEEPKSVSDYRDMGLPARSAVKGPGSVEYGFKWLQRRTLVIDPARTPKAYEEITSYEYERDKEGNIISGYPDGNDHAISALRYAMEPLFIRRGNSA